MEKKIITKTHNSFISRFEGIVTFKANWRDPNKDRNVSLRGNLKTVLATVT